MDRLPSSLIEFQQQFGSEEACARYLADLRWPDGFVCPCCQSRRNWALKTKPDTFECANCGRQTSVTAGVTAGTILHASKLPLTVWFLAAYFMATHSNGLSARQLQSLLGLGSYRTAWMLAAKLRRAMVAPDRRPLAGLVEVDGPLGNAEGGKPACRCAPRTILQRVGSDAATTARGWSSVPSR